MSIKLLQPCTAKITISPELMEKIKLRMGVYIIEQHYRDDDGDWTFNVEEIHPSYKEVEDALKSYTDSIVVFPNDHPYTLMYKGKTRRVSYEIDVDSGNLLIRDPDDPIMAIGGVDGTIVHKKTFYRVRWVSYGKVIYPPGNIVVEV